ncbi:MAG TPA: porin [Nitrospiraceae bacterium]|nr:porin [Nitrospiraceae bacterium]
MNVRLQRFHGTVTRLVFLACLPTAVIFAPHPWMSVSTHAQEAAPVPAPATPKPPGPFESGFKTPATLPSVEGITVEDLMLEKGLITMDDYLRLKAEAERRATESAIVAEYTASPRWYERLRHYGYGMFRYNQLGNPNGQVRTYHDASVGDVANGAQPGFFYRRIRWVVTGQVSDRVGIFIQPDLASNISGNTHVLTMRDAWGEYYFDKNKEFRFRVGLQRVPVSWDNWQASRQRIAIDRADATNSGAQSERDMGISFQWTPKFAQHRWKQMIDYLYGAGDWGMINVTVYNGQGLNAPEINKDKHVGIRLAYPFELPGGRLFEIGMNAYRGQFSVSPGTPATGTTLFSRFDGGHQSGKYLDERLNFFIYYPPQPWGFIAEYVIGRGPERDQNGIIRESALYGGYIQGHYMWKYSDVALANFYARYQTYHGGLKFQTGAPNDTMQETELGVAWMPDPQWEFTVAYTFTERINVFQTTPGTATNPGQQFNAYGNLIRLQLNWFWN